MNNDLISREALKKAIEKAFEEVNLSEYEACVCVCEIYDKQIDNAPTVDITEEQAIDKLHKTGWLPMHDKEMTERPQGEPVIKCQDCKYRVKEWREDKRMKGKGYWVYGCKHFGEIIGFWGFGGNDNEFCSYAEQKGGAE